MAEVQIQSISHRHREIADWLLANPHVKNLNALCDRMNVSRSWLSIVMNSDVFKEYFEKRRRSYEGVLHEEILMKNYAVTSKALDKLSVALDDDGVDPRLLLDVANKTAQLLGYGAKGPVTKVTEEKIQEITRPVDAGALAQAREIMRRTTKTEYEIPALPAPESP